MELLEAIHNRRSTKKFSDKTLSDDVLEDILEAGTWAPSHGNKQPWEFIIFGEQTRKKLSEWYLDFIETGQLKNPDMSEEKKESKRNFARTYGNAPVLMAVSYLPPDREIDNYDYPLATAACIQNILLAASEQGVSGVWLSLGAHQAVREIAGVPEGGKIAGIILLGYPESTSETKGRIPAKEKIRRLP